MADQGNESQDSESQDTEQTSGGGRTKLLVIGGIGLTLLVVGIFAGPTIKNMISPPPADESETEEAAEPDSSRPQIYQSLSPPLIVNFTDAYGDGHYMQMTLEIMSRDQEIINAVREHTPAIRSALILLCGAAEYEVVITREGKEQMLADTLAEIQAVLMAQAGQSGIEAVYFTSLVIQ